MSAQRETVTVGDLQVPLIYEQNDLIPIVSMQIVFQNAGSIDDGDLPGLARISSQMLNEGTKAMGASAFAEKLESKAIELRAGNGRETFVINLDSLKSEFDEGLDLLKALLKDPNLTDNAIGKVKTKLLGQLKRKENDYDYIASRKLYEQIFKGTPIANPTLGNEESILKITLDDVKEYLDNGLTQRNAIVVIGGDIDLNSSKKMAADIISLLPKGTKKEMKFYAAAQAKDVITKKETEQAYVYFGAPFAAHTTDKDVYKAKVAAFILGSSGFGSRLMEEIRVKRGLAYSAYCRTSLAMSHSYFSGHLQTKLESQEEAIKVVKELIAEFIKNGATQKELEGAKKFLLGSEPLRTETLSQRLSRSFTEFYEGKPTHYAQDELILIESLTLNELNQYIQIHPEIADLTFSVVTK